MKNTVKLFLIAVSVVIMSSCSDYLDTKQFTSSTSDIAISSYSEAFAALVGMYDGLQGSSSRNTYYAARMIFYGDVRGDDMQASGTGMRTSPCYEMRYNDDNAPIVAWDIPYNVILRANDLIKALDAGKVTDASEEEIGELRAQALVTRALCHFDLVRIYGKPFPMDNGSSFGVPIVLEPLDKFATPSRNSVAEVYNQVIKDLKDAIDSEFLNTGKDVGFFNEWAAKALLCRVYLYKEANQEALSLAKDIIENSPYSLWTNAQYGVSGTAGVWARASIPANDEVIFELINTDTSDWGDREGIGYLMSEAGYADMVVTQMFSDLLNEDTDDVRHLIVQASTAAANITKFETNRVWCNKFRGKTGGQIPIANLPILRLSEVYLNGAEAAVKLSGANLDIAAEYVETIAKRANPATTESITSTNITLDRVLKERRKELVGEGHRFFDALRNNLTITRYTDEAAKGWHYTITEEKSRQFDRTYYRTILPIPIGEMNANPALKDQQNPGY